ncbi:MAG: O-methyltransferase [Bacteroidetes bacterium]|nr:O-methyltransferase [Bacteroidota bacterium]
MEKKAESYAVSLSSPELPILNRIYRETHIRQPFPRMVSGHQQGLLLQMISRMVRPDIVLEIGSFTGYSAICLAQGLTEDGRVHTLEINEELGDGLKEYFREAGLEKKIHLHLGNAIHLIPELENPFDLVFIDADKEQYLDYYHLVFEKVRPGGIILADNVLWGGKVLGDVAESDKEAQGILRFNNFIRTDDRIERLLLPLRDGLMVLYKK